VTITDGATSFPILLSGWALIVALIGFYVGRSLWIARREWSECATDTKVLYLMVAPPLTLAVDLLQATDRLFWRRAARKAALETSRGHQRARVRPTRPAARVSAKPALRTNG
jgi:hypothetical protein